MYTPIGIVETPRKVVFLRNLAVLVSLGGEWTRFTSEALRLVFHERNNLFDLRFPAILGVAAHPKFGPGTSPCKALMTLLSMVCEDLDVFKVGAKTPTYRVDPVLQWSELVERVVANRITSMSRESLDGDNTKWGSFVYEFIMYLNDALRVSADIQEISSDLEDIRRHVVWKLAHAAALDAHERSFLLCYCCGSPYLPEGFASKSRRILAQQVTLQRTLATWEEAKQCAMAGPISRFFKIISNKQLESLTAQAVVGIRSLPLSVGSFFVYGPYLKAKMTTIAEIPFSELTQMAGLREAMVFPSGAVAGNPRDADLYKELCTPSWPAMIDEAFNPFANSGLPFDIEDVAIRMRGDSLSEELPYAGLIASWYSEWRGREISTLTGATSRDMLTDIALTHESFGGGELGGATIADGDVVALDDLSTESLRTRLFTFGSTAVGSAGTAELNPLASIKFKMFYRRNGQLAESDVDVRWYYAQRGAAFVKPAFAELMRPSIAMLYAPNASAVDWIAAELNLTSEERTANDVALTVCFNYHEISAVIGASALARVNLRQLVKTLSQI